MRFRLLSCTVFVVLCLVSSPLHAETPVPQRALPDLPEAVALDELLRLVEAHSPQLKAERAEIEVVRVDLIEAGLLPNPEFAIEVGRHAHGTPAMEGTEIEIGLAQPLLLFGQRPARRAAAEQRVAAAEAEYALAFNELARDVRELFLNLLVHQRRAELYEEARRNIEEAHRVVSGRVQAGAESPYDLLRLEIQAAEVLLSIHEVRADIEEASAELARHVGHPSWRPRALGELEPRGLDTELDVLWERASRDHPGISWMERIEAAALREIDVARSERWGEPVIGLGTLITTDDYSLSLIASLEFELPFFNRNQAELARAHTEVIAARRAREALIHDLRTDLEGALRILETRTSAREELSTVIERLPQLRQMSEEGYRLGQMGILDLLDALDTIVEIQLADLELLEGVLEAEISVLDAIGRAGIVE